MDECDDNDDEDKHYHYVLYKKVITMFQHNVGCSLHSQGIATKDKSSTQNSQKSTFLKS